MKNLLKLLVGAGLFLVSVGCSQRSTYIKSNDYRDIFGADEGKAIMGQASACKFRFDEGGSAEKQPDDVKETYFNKTFAKNHIKALFGASGSETIKYMESLGQVKVYRADLSDHGCPFYNSVNQAPSDLADYWQKENGNNKDSILGMYLADNSPLVPGHEPTILIRMNTDRWTAVHEFTHHLFETEGVKAGVAQAVVFKDFIDNAKALDALQGRLAKLPENEQIEALRKLIHMYAKHLSYENHFVTSSALEEVTIETGMMENFSQFSFMPKNFDNSIAYIVGNATHAKETLDKFIEGGNKLIQSLESDRESAALFDLTELKSVVKSLQFRKDQIAPVVAHAYTLFNDGKSNNLMMALMGNGLMPAKSQVDEGSEGITCGYGDAIMKAVEAVKISELKF